MSIPAASRINYNFYDRFRREMFPAIADIPTVKSMAPERVISREAYCSHRNSGIINNYLMKHFKTYPPPGKYVDHREAMNYLYYSIGRDNRPDHYRRLAFLRSYLVFVIWYNNYFMTDRFSRMKNELQALSALPLIRIKHLMGR